MAGANVPKLRFPEFSGEWEEKKFGELGDFYGGGTPDTKVDEYWNGEIPWISSSDLFEDSITNISITRHISKLAVKESATKLIPSNSILIVSRVGVGKFAVSNFELATSQDFTNFTPCKDNPKFLAYWLSFDKKSLLNLCQGTSIKGFTTVDLKSLTVKIPLMPEQTKIAEFLGVVDEKIKALRQKHGLLKDYKRGIMQKIFTQQIRFKKDDGTTFPDWEEKSLIEVACFRRGSFPQPYGLPEWYDEENGMPFVQVYDVDDNFKLKNTTKQKISKLASKQSVFVPMGSLLVTIQGSIGRIAVTQYDAYVDRTLLIFTSFKTEIDIRFFSYILFLLFEIEKDKAPGGTIKTITKEVLSDFLILLPHPDEQQKIADFLSSIDNKIDATQSQIDQMTQFKKGLLQQMFV